MPLPIRFLRAGLALALALVVTACGLPRGGPYYDEITAESGGEGGYGFHVMPVTPEIVATTRIDEKSGFSVSFLEAGQEPLTVARGDVMAITVWETSPGEGLLSQAGIGASPLPNMKVDERGYIFVPYVGLVRAAGRSLHELRQAIQSGLSTKTLEPQVDVFPVEAIGRAVSIQGRINKPGLYPIDQRTHHILPMLANAGGTTEDPEVIKIKLRRGNIQGDIWLQDLYDDPVNDVHLRSGDAIIAERDRRIFTALGAVRGPSTIQFPTRDVSVVRALGTVGGLVDQSADPTGVFLFREEPEEIARRLLPGQEINGPQRVAYIVDLTQPAGMFLARDMMLRDGNTLYVTTAPFVRWLKILQAISPLISFGGSARTLGGF